MRLTDRGLAYNAFEGTSDARARIEIERLAEGAFELVIAHPGLWPTQVTVHALRHAPDEIVQVRRIGSIEFAVRNTAGVPVANAPIALSSLEFGRKVSDWIAAGRVAAPLDMRTYAGGRLRIDGLPRGEYRWSFEALEGSATVPPQGCANVTVVVP